MFGLKKSNFLIKISTKAYNVHFHNVNYQSQFQSDLTLFQLTIPFVHEIYRKMALLITYELLVEC